MSLHPKVKQELTLNALAMLAGALATLGFAPWEWWPLTLISVALFFIGLQSASAKQALMRGWSYGFGFFLSSVSWVYVSIHQFGAASTFLAASLTLAFAAALALFFSLHAWCYWRCSRTIRQPWLSALIFAAVWVLAEAFRGWFLTGFPWLLVGYAPMDTTLAGWAPITGVLGLSFFSVLTATALVISWQSGPARSRLILLVIAVTPFFIGSGLSQLNFTQSKQDPISFTLIQGNTPQEQKWLPSQRQRIVNQYIATSLNHLDSSLIIWPETAVPQLLSHAMTSLKPLDTYLRKQQIALLTGMPTASHAANGRTSYFNSVVSLGDAEGTYHKQRLVPFGEYVPLESQLRGLIDFFDLPMSNFSLGPDNQNPLIIQNGIQISPYICYEIVYPDLVAKAPGDILLTVSNDSWFGDSLAPHQHLQMARMRAIENERELIRATNNGISALVDSKGKVTEQTEQFVATTLSGEVTARTGLTPFGRTGSWPIIGLALLLVLSSLWANRRRLATQLQT